MSCEIAEAGGDKAEYMGHITIQSRRGKYWRGSCVGPFGLNKNTKMFALGYRADNK